jgi:membrane protein DedA with SNARE-associated domain
MHRFYQHYLDSIQAGGYPIIILLMAMESSVLPVPSEFVIPIAAYYAYTHQSNTSVLGVVIAAAFGSWVGATIMYWGARLAGRPLVLKYGRYLLISESKVEAAEAWSARFGQMGVFISRLLPVIRHLIGIPSGIVRLNFAKYSLFTVLGSAVWCAVLARVGIIAGNNPELMHGDLRMVAMWVIGVAVILGGMYYFFVYRFHRRSAGTQSR